MRKSFVVEMKKERDLNELKNLLIKVSYLLQSNGIALLEWKQPTDTVLEVDLEVRPE